MSQYMGPQTTGQAHPNPHAQHLPGAVRAEAAATAASLPAALCDVALIDGYTCAAVGAMSISQWHDLVRQKLAPQPAIREPRFTRWRVADVFSYYESRIKAAQTESASANAVIENARKASTRARELRGQKVEA